MSIIKPSGNRMKPLLVDYIFSETLRYEGHTLIYGTEKIEAPKVKPLDQKQILLSLLPEEFESKMLLEEAQSQGIPRRTVFRWNDEWQEHGVILKIRHGVYRKQFQGFVKAVMMQEQ